MIQLKLEEADQLISSYINKKTRNEVRSFWGYNKKGIPQSVIYRKNYLNTIKLIREMGGLARIIANLMRI